jgi:DNA-binding winged helix-turn-helix (wHTH) protein/Tfp pilus assembly protein PilF
LEPQERRILEFGEFSLDVEERKVLRRGQVLPMTGRLFDVLLVLAENPARLVDSDQFMKRVWPDTYVAEGTLARNISRLRQALGEQKGGHEFIEAVPKRGYRFNTTVKEVKKREEEPQPALAPQSNLEVPAAGVSTHPPSLSYRLLRSWRPAGALALVVTAAAAAAISLGYLAFRSGRVAVSGVSEMSRATKIDPAAYEAYVKGRYFWGKRDHASYQKSLALFQEAIDRDPDFALAYCGLADANAMGGDWNKAEPLAERALALDPSTGEAHASLGFLKMFWQWNWEAADAHFRKAIELNPNYAPARQWYGLSLAYCGRFDEALSQLGRAHEIDPLSPAISTDLGEVLCITGQYDRAIEQGLRAIEIQPDFIFAHNLLSRAYDQKGMYAEEVEQAAIADDLERRAYGPSAQWTLTADSMRRAFREGGFQRYRRKCLEDDLQKAAYYDAARNCILLGNPKQALRQLELGAGNRQFQMLSVGVDRVFFPLHGDPAFQQILQSIGLPTLD